MREIKFRAWSKSRNKFFDPDFIDCDGQCWDTNHVHETLPTDDYILMQFTGLYDKNGKEIYEGDVLKWRCSTSESKSNVMLRTVSIDWGCWPTSHGYAITIYINGEKYASGKSYWNNEDREIIGNIYENTELIKA